MPDLDPRLQAQSPARILSLVLLLVFTVEGAIMLLLPRLAGEPHDPLTEGLLDASILTVIVAPAVWFLAVRPLRRLFEARGQLLRRLFESQEQERGRVARDLHDGVGQQLTALMVGLRTVEEAADLDTARSRAASLREFAALAHGEVRRLARGLRPTILEELGLVAALERLCEDFGRTHALDVAASCDLGESERLPPTTETALYRIAQEALSNVVRHAGASQARLRLAREGTQIHLSIHDDGCGFDAAAAETPLRRESGYGLGSIRERTLLLEGKLTLRSRAGEGTTVDVLVPAGA